MMVYTFRVRRLEIVISWRWLPEQDNNRLFRLLDEWMEGDPAHDAEVMALLKRINSAQEAQ
jgi:hypothetical protein